MGRDADAPQDCPAEPVPGGTAGAVVRQTNRLEPYLPTIIATMTAHTATARYQ